MHIQLNAIVGPVSEMKTLVMKIIYFFNTVKLIEIQNEQVLCDSFDRGWGTLHLKRVQRSALAASDELTTRLEPKAATQRGWQVLMLFFLKKIIFTLNKYKTKKKRKRLMTFKRGTHHFLYLKIRN